MGFEGQKLEERVGMGDPHYPAARLTQPLRNRKLVGGSKNKCGSEPTITNNKVFM